MNIDASTSTPAQIAEWTAYEATTAQHAITPDAKAENTRQVAALAEWASKAHQAEHIRGMIAVTMAMLSRQAAPAALANATQWQNWALEFAADIES